MKFSAHTMDYVNEFMAIPDYLILEESAGLAVSGYLVMASAAGWYVGRVCRDSEFPDLLQPYCRSTGYMSEPDAIKTYEHMFKEGV